MAKPLNRGERQIQTHVADVPGAETGFQDPRLLLEDDTERQSRNLRELLLVFNNRAVDPRARAHLLEELRKGDGIDFPAGSYQRIAGRGASDNMNAPEMEFSVLGKKDAAAAPKGDEMKFSILGRQPATEETVEEPEGVALPGERAYTPEGAVTGRSQVPFPRYDVRGPGSPDTSKALRLGVETGATFLGGSALGALGTAAGGPALGAAGLRTGEAAGAFAGSLLSEPFDPSERPFREAAKAAGITLGTGLIATGATGLFRKLIGKPSEGGRALIDIMAADGKVPLPGAVLESEFIKNAQSFGSAAFGTNKLLKDALQQAEDVTSKAVRDYVSGFQRYHDSSKQLFALVDQKLVTPLPQQTTGTVGSSLAGSASIPMQTSGPNWLLKGDERARDAMMDVVNNWVNRTGRVDAMPTGLQKMYLWAQQPGMNTPRFTFEETQQVYEALFNKARALDFAARKGDVTEIAGTNTAAYIREQAIRVKNAFDDQIDAAIASKQIDPDTKILLQSARANWDLWVQGKELERMITASTKDIAGTGTIKGSKLLNELDKVQRLDQQVTGGTRATLNKTTTENIRRYALAAEAVEKSGKAGAFVLAGRVGQLAALTGVGFGLASGGQGAAIFLAPHVLAWSFSNPHVASLLIRGLRVKPGTAAAARITRELASLWEKEQLMTTEDDKVPQNVE